MPEWVESNGGPLLVLQRDLLGFWDGTRPPAAFRRVQADFRWKEAGPASDYDRACDIRDHVGLIEVGPGFGLVLGDEPLPTTYLTPIQVGQNLLVRWIQADSDADVMAAVKGGLDKLAWASGPEYRIDQPELVLFDSAFGGDEVPRSSLGITVPPGRYVVETAKLDWRSKTSLLVHRFTARR